MKWREIPTPPPAQSAPRVLIGYVICARFEQGARYIDVPLTAKGSREFLADWADDHGLIKIEAGTVSAVRLPN